VTSSLAMFEAANR